MNRLLSVFGTILRGVGRFKLILITAVVTGLILTPIVAPVRSDNSRRTTPKKVEVVLGEKATPTPTQLPTPIALPTIIARRVLSPTPTQTPTPEPTSAPATNTSSSTTSPTITPASNAAAATAAPTSAPTPTAAPTTTPTPTPAGVQVAVSIDYSGQKSNDSYNTTVEEGQNAWEAIKKAVGIENLAYTDYGGDLGIFITGFNGINAAGNQFYEFKVNGVSSNVGVSSYVCQDGDSLSFVLTTF